MTSWRDLLPTIPAVGRVPVLNRVKEEVAAAAVLARAGVIRPVRPDRLLAAVDGLLRFGTTVTAELIAAAALRPDAIAIYDEDGSVTYAELVAQSAAVAGRLPIQRVHEGDRMALLAPNSRFPIVALAAAGRLGADTLLLNTGLSAGQVAELCAREQVKLLIVDPTLAQLAASVGAGTVVADDLTGLAEQGSDEVLPLTPGHKGHVVVMTSGTTGAPKGARRKDPTSLVPPAALLSRIPYRAAGVTVIAAPLFHTWGFANLQLGLVLGSTLILHKRFDPRLALAAVQEHRADTLVAVPVMLSRLLDVPASDRPDTTSLRIACVSGSALPGPLATRFQDAFGDIVYNLYGSTEVSWVSIATPEDLRADDGTAGKAPLGTRLMLLDEQGLPVPAGEVGRIFVGNALLFDGYTGGVAGPDSVDGMMATGDLGRLDTDGRLTVLGRSDGMVVSGGENVFPSEIEDLLAGHPGVKEAAVIGVDDSEWGQRLAAFVVLDTPESMTVDSVRELVKSRLAKFAVPRDVVFLDELPRNPTGKVLGGKLRELLPTAAASNPLAGS